MQANKEKPMSRATRFIGLNTIVISLCLFASAPVAGAKKVPKAAQSTQTDRQAPANAVQTRSVTMPLSEVLELYLQQEKDNDIKQVNPPLDAVVRRLQVQGRILDQAITATIKVSVEVLNDSHWVVVPLLNLGTQTVIDKLPSITGATLAIADGQLQLLAKRKGRFDFTLGVLSSAQVQGQQRSASIAFAGATLVQCNLSYDSSIFELLSEVKVQHGDTLSLHTHNKRCDIKWQHRQEYIAPETILAESPEAEPVIPSAHASLVSTLEGEHILRIAYALRFAGRKSIEFDLPKNHSLLRAYLNGQPIATSQQSGHISLEVFAAQAGQTGGQLELVLTARNRDYLLSGRLPLVLPRASWRTNELHFSTYLPAAFDYRWTNGTLSPAKNSPRTQFVYDIPAPGKALHFHQFLVHRSTPSLTLEYAVSLKGKYFRGGG